MKPLRSIAGALALAVLPFASVAGDGTGDADGDGRLSLADSIHLHDRKPVPEAFWEGYRDWFCLESFDEPENLAAGIYLESLRRACGSAYPHWDAIWDPAAIGAAWEPAPADERFRVQVESITAPGEDSDRVEVVLLLLVSEPVRAFSIVLDVEDSILRPITDVGIPDFWSSHHWRWATGVFKMGGPCGDFWCSNTPHTYLISGGKFVVVYSPLHGLEESIPPGAHVLSVEARIGKGTAAGDYSIRLHPGSEVVFEDGALGAPGADRAEAMLIVSRIVEAGWDAGPPPLRFDPADRRVLGKVEFRMIRADGRVTEPGEPLFAGLPGEEFRVRVQMRSEVPLNGIGYNIRWFDESVRCADFQIVNLFRNPEDGELYLPVRTSTIRGPGSPGHCASSVFQSTIWHEVELGGHGRTLHTNYRKRPLEYFKPLGAWVDLIEASLRISETAAGGTRVPLRFVPYHDSFSGLRGPLAEFWPYQYGWRCGDSRLWPETPYWKYDIAAAEAWIEVLGDNPPPPDPALGVRFEIGNANASPGEVVELPVLARSEKPVSLLQLALGYDAAQVEVIRFDAWIEGLNDVMHRVEVAPGGAGMIRECVQVAPDREECFPGNPFAVVYKRSDAGSLVLQFLALEGFPGPVSLEVGRLIARVRDGASVAETQFAAKAVIYDDRGIPREAVSGAFASVDGTPGSFSPAASVTGGAIRLGEASFRRGDSNLDGLSDISDAVFTLGYLFLGTESPGCLDAADADDSGEIDITDPVFALGVQFLGQGAIPPPSPGCGADPTQDLLTCDASCR